MQVVFTIYRTTNLVNGKIYVGAHKTANPNDSYKGSGTALKAALKKYGTKSFRKEVLFVFDSMAEMLAKEAELVTPEFVARDDNYNLKEGGRYGTLSLEAKRKISEAGKIAQNRPELVEANRRRGKRRMAIPEVKAKFHEGARCYANTPEAKKKARESLRETADLRAEGLQRVWDSYSEEERAQRVEATAEACRTDEYRAKMSAASKAALARPEVKKKHRKAVKSSWTPERRARQRERMKALHADPEWGARQAAAISRGQRSPEGRKNMARRRRQGENEEDWKTRLASS